MHNMKVEDFFDHIAPMVEELAQDKETALFLLGGDAEKDCGAIKGRTKDLVLMLVMQMVRQEDVAHLIMSAASAFIEYHEDNAKGQQQKLS